MAEGCHCGREGVTAPKEDVVKRLEKQFPGLCFALCKGSVGRARFCCSSESIGHAHYLYAHFYRGKDCALAGWQPLCLWHIFTCAVKWIFFLPFFMCGNKNMFVFFLSIRLFTLRGSIIVRRLAFVLWLLVSLADCVPVHRVVNTRRCHKHGAK